MSDLITPFHPLEPSSCGVLAEHLGRAMERIKGWGLVVHPQSRVPQAIALLRQILERLAYAGDAKSLVRAGNAIKLAFDVVRIADAFPDDPPKQLLDALKRVLDGTLDDVGPTQPTSRAE